jgi:ubiquinone/menaquinone biosynthesis C-methylase UbiE
VRSVVSNEFGALVKGTNVLDFGGGTGLDLNWLTDLYRVFFLEPSVNMRHVAQSKWSTNVKIFFVENNIDFNTWRPTNLPFAEKMDGVLMNFAVLNCIKEIDLLFEKIAIVCNRGAYTIALVIDEGKIKRNPVKRFIDLSMHKPSTLYNNNSGIRHKTYLHSKAQLASASQKWFNFISCNSVDLSNFLLLTLMRK